MLITQQLDDEILDIRSLAFGPLSRRDRRLRVRPSAAPSADALRVGSDLPRLVDVVHALGAHQHDASALSDVLRRRVRAHEPLQYRSLRRRHDHNALRMRHAHLRWSGV